MSLRARHGWLLSVLIEHRSMLSFGLSVASGIILQSVSPVRGSDPLLRLLALERPAIFLVLVRSYDIFLYSTPFMVLSILFSLGYFHFYAAAQEFDRRAVAAVSRSTRSKVA